MTENQDTGPDLSVVEGKATTDIVTVYLADQLFGIPVLSVHDVLKPRPITPVPHAPESVAGVLNLRGKIVTAIDLRVNQGFPPREKGEEHMSVVVEHEGESYSLLFDRVGDVISLPDDSLEKNPATLDERLRRISAGIYRLDEGLLVLLDVGRTLDLQVDSEEAA